MGILVRLITGAAGPYLLLGTLLLLGGSWGWAAYNHQAAKRYQVERDAAQKDLTAALAALDGKDATIRTLQSGLETWQKSAIANSDAALAAGKRAEEWQTKFAGASADLRQRERASDALPSCEEYLSIDVAAVCSSRAMGVRERAARGLPRPTD